jgi:hypothetical protein
MAVFLPAPEPDTLAIMLVGRDLLGFMPRRRRQKAAYSKFGNTQTELPSAESAYFDGAAVSLLLSGLLPLIPMAC